MRGGFYPLLVNGINVPLQVSGGSGLRPVQPARRHGRGPQAGSCNSCCTSTTGRIMPGKPSPVDIPERPGAIAGLMDSDRPRAVPKFSCEVNLADGAKIKHHAGGTTIELPGGKAMVNSPQFKLFNAPSALVRVPGEFVAVVEVAERL